MTDRLPPDIVAGDFLAACRDELTALKPGNVHIFASGHDMEPRHFEVSAAAAAPAISSYGQRVGRRILDAVTASFQAAGCNTNLGIVLLCAPVAVAVEDLGPAPPPAAPESRAETIKRLQRSLARVLADLDQLDAKHAFAAIALANPAGLGDAPSEDVKAPPTDTFLRAMQLAAHRDRISRAYATDYEDIFTLGLPAYETALASAERADLAITTLHMTYLAAFEDSHIARKHGAKAAQTVRQEAAELARLCNPTTPRTAFEALLEFDRSLKQRGLNPGTTADLVVATLFINRLIKSILGNSLSQRPCLKS